MRFIGILFLSVSMLLLSGCYGLFGSGGDRVPDSVLNQMQLQDGIRASDRGNVPVAIKLLRPLAEKGDAVAQYRFGRLYLIHWGGAEQNKRAEKLFGIKMDYAEALKWFRKSAEQGNKDAMLEISNMYAEGLGGVREDYVEVYFWVSLARKHGQPGNDFDLPITDEQKVAVNKRVEEWLKAHPTPPSHCTSNELGLDLCGGSHIIYSEPPESSPANNK
ncbi:MAG: tetratricopeptide repeat protein [Alphaproteobacteria bacterium]